MKEWMKGNAGKQARDIGKKKVSKKDTQERQESKARN